MDFMSDQLSPGRRFRLSNVIDDFTEQCHTMTVDIFVSGSRMARELGRLVALNGKPEFIVCDNGAEYAFIAVFDWSRCTGIAVPPRFIRRSKPGQNGIIEAFNGRVQNICLNG